MLHFALLALVALASLPTPSPTPAPTSSPLREITRVTGRGSNLVRTATAASTGTISLEQIATRPILRPAEVLEAIPGLVISQHSGEGKANQYYLRGFQLDHGTDLEATIAGFPINLPTHAHGQGYSDINWLIPETVAFVQFDKGPYYASRGDFSTAGAYELSLRNTLPSSVSFSAGSFGYERLLMTGTRVLGIGHLAYAFEALHNDGSLARPDDYRKLNALARWSRETPSGTFAVTALAYSGIFNSSDQIPQRAVDDGSLPRNGLIDGSDGGFTSHYGISLQTRHADDRSESSFTAYGFEQYLDLFSNFTFYADDAADYYNVHGNPLTCDTRLASCSPGPGHITTYTSYCPENRMDRAFSFACGDQREQRDQRFVSGFDARKRLIDRAGETLGGIALRNDNISTIGLYLTHGRVRYADGTLGDDRVTERDISAFVQRSQTIGRLRAIGGVRADAYSFAVGATSPIDSGRVHAAIVSPKLSFAYAFDRTHEAYLNFGESYHSNDARGLTQTLDPQTHQPFDATGNLVQRVSPLVRAEGAEAGYRLSTRTLTSTVSLWQLHLDSELVFDGDHGVTSAGRPTIRQGIEISNFYRPNSRLTYDFDYATSSARFTEDPRHIGTQVPESLRAVASAGLTYDGDRYSASLRARYFGPRVLVEDGSAYSRASLLWNAQYMAKLPQLRLQIQALNIFNARSDDVTYYYASWLPSDARSAAGLNASLNPAFGGSGIADFHSHPSQARTLRITLQRPL